MKNQNPFRYFKTSPEIIRLAVMMYVRFPLSLRNVEDLLHERASISAMILSAIGGTDFALYSLVKSARNDITHRQVTPTGKGMRTYYTIAVNFRL